MSEELQLQTPYLKLAARAWGPPGGQPVLALHGWLDNAASFERLASLLPELRVVALDLPGHGLSEWRPRGVHYHFVDFVFEAVMAADALGWNRFTLLGHSLGASIACFTAAIAPERITRLALIEGLGPLTGEPADAPARLATAVTQMERLRQKSAPAYNNPEQAIQARQRAGDLTYQAAAALAERGLQALPEGVGWRSDPALTLRSPLYLTEDQVLAFLAAIQAPALLIQAESGLLTNRRALLTRRLEQMANLQVRHLPGGHHLHLDDPQPVAAAIAEFLETRRLPYSR